MAHEREFYIFDPKVIDGSKIREQAGKIQRGDYYEEGSSCTVHMHRLGSACNSACELYEANADGPIPLLKEVTK